MPTSYTHTHTHTHTYTQVRFHLFEGALYGNAYFILVLVRRLRLVVALVGFGLAVKPRVLVDRLGLVVRGELAPRPAPVLLYGVCVP